MLFVQIKTGHRAVFMLELGQINEIGIAVFGRELYEQYQLLIVSVCAIIILYALYWLVLRFTQREHGVLWSKPPEKESRELMRMREDERNKF